MVVNSFSDQGRSPLLAIARGSEGKRHALPRCDYGRQQPRDDEEVLSHLCPAAINKSALDVRK